MSAIPSSSPRSTESSPTPYIPPSQPSLTPSGWSLGSISSYLGTCVPSNTSLFGRCIIWLQGVWQRFLDLFYKSTPIPPPAETPLSLPFVSDEILMAPLVETPLKSVSEPSPNIEDEVQKKVGEFKGEIFRGTLYITSRSALYIGKDESYEFGKVLQPLMTREPLEVSTWDICLSCEIKEAEENFFSIDLPSSLFSQARVGNKVYYLFEGALFIYELSNHPGLPHVSFDAALEYCKVYTKQYCPGEFFDEQDVPDDYHYWGDRYRPGGIYLSPQTKQIRVGIPGAIPADFTQLKPLHHEHGQPESRSKIIKTTTPNVLPAGDEYSNLRHSILQNSRAYFHITQIKAWPEIDILLDGRRLFVRIDNSSHSMYLKENRINLTVLPLAQSFFKTLLPYREEEFDPQNIVASLDNTGILTLVIPLRPEAFSQGGTYEETIIR